MALLAAIAALLASALPAISNAGSTGEAASTPRKAQVATISHAGTQATLRRISVAEDARRLRNAARRTSAGAVARTASMRRAGGTRSGGPDGRRAASSARSARSRRARQSSVSLPQLRSQLQRELKAGGRASSAYVYDVSSAEALFSLRPRVLRAPASVEKLYTATAALMRLGPTARVDTSVLSTGDLRANGVWEGNLYLRGGGDPTFGTRAFIASHYENKGASISTLVNELTKADGIRAVRGNIEGDESYFDSLRGEPSSGYAQDPWLEGTLSALAFNRGATAGLKGLHAPAAYAAQQLLRALRKAGVRVEGRSGAATTPSSARTLAKVRSPTLSTLLHLMLPPSDNYFAETIVKDLGARLGGAGTTAVGASIVRGTIAKLGLHPEIVDGSGLSRADHTSAIEVVTLLRWLMSTQYGETLRADLAFAGETGTLSERMRGSAAQGRCEGKTGTLTGVSNLAGYCEAANGHLIAFAIFNDRIATAAAHNVQDAVTESIAGY